jgi:hypothetical protein
VEFLHAEKGCRVGQQMTLQPAQGQWIRDPVPFNYIWRSTSLIHHPPKGTLKHIRPSFKDKTP